MCYTSSERVDLDLRRWGRLAMTTAKGTSRPGHLTCVRCGLRECSGLVRTDRMAPMLACPRRVI